jgi:hemerythrin
MQSDPCLLVGNEQMDREHRQLFEIAEKVYDALSGGNAAAIGKAHAAISELLKYAETHFASEEALMQSVGYPYLETHRTLHNHLLTQVRDMELRALSGEPYVPVELNRFINKWLVSHIQTNDRMFGEFLSSRLVCSAEFAEA